MAEGATDGMEEYPKCVATNFDQSWDEEVATALQAVGPKTYAQYSGWNFCGRVWWTGTEWACEVWVYGVPEQVIRASTGAELMAKVSNEYGAG